MLPSTETELEDLLATPSSADVECMRRLSGDVLILGAGGKMGPSLARRIQRAAQAAQSKRRVMAVSRFASAQARAELESAGIETIACDLLDRTQINQLPDCENVWFLAGRKFGSTERTDLTWASNTYAPALVAERYRTSRIVVFSTGNVYPMVGAASCSFGGGSVESDATQPQGEYAQSCLGRERIFEYFSNENGTRCLLFRLNYAVDLRYGVLVDIARKVYAGEPVNLSVAAFNVIWQGDANSYALRANELCDTPPRILNVTGPETLSTQRTAEFFAQRWQREAIFQGEPTPAALLNNAALCHSRLGYPSVSAQTLMEMVAHWVESGGASLNKPTKFEVTDGKF
ncbi:MAG: NAD-dependent epimerase/dehydratase family protein [Acidobacteria bacterium]|nr:NAD-dependent epimerase/dehydratase family protein [Acidobacteriota bacterium]